MKCTTASLPALGLALALFLAAGAARASDDNDCVETFLGWTPEGTAFALHEYCSTADCGWIRLVDIAKGTDLKLCDCDDACAEAKAAAEHPVVVALKLVPSGKPLPKLKPKVSRVKDKLRFELRGGKKPLLLGTRDASCGEGCKYEWRFKRALWEPKGRAVACELSERLKHEGYGGRTTANRHHGFKSDAAAPASRPH